MNTRNKTGLEIIQTAAIIGLLGNVMLRETPWGLNAFLFVGVFVAGMLMLMRRHRPELLNLTNLSLAGAMVVFASMFLLRDAEELLVVDTLAILALMGVVVLSSFDVKAHIGGAFHYIAGFFTAAFGSIFGGFLLLGADIDWKAMPGNKISRNVFAVLRGVAIALPLVLIFGGLFMAADAVFEGWVNKAVNFQIDEVISHVVLTSVFAWLTAGYFRTTVGRGFAAAAASAAVHQTAAEPAETNGALPNNATILEHINISDPPNATEGSKTEASEPVASKKRDWQKIDNSFLPSVFTLGTVETVIILGLVDLLFLGFVIAQVPYLFGGMELVRNTPELGLADYARRGFGELVAVAALVLPILLVSHWLVRRDGSRASAIFRILAGVQVVLLFVIMASAMQRLVLLTGEFGYGLTTVRLYPMIFMGWLAIVFVWFSYTVLARSMRSRFAWGALWSAVVILGVTNLINPHALIVRTNIALMQQGRPYDAIYNSNLSDDSLPLVVQTFEQLSDEDRRTALASLAWQHCKNKQSTDLRTWNLSRAAARSALAEYDEILSRQMRNCNYSGD